MFGAVQRFRPESSTIAALMRVAKGIRLQKKVQIILQHSVARAGEPPLWSRGYGRGVANGILPFPASPPVARHCPSLAPLASLVQQGNPTATL